MSLTMSWMSCRQSTTLGTNPSVDVCCAAAAPSSSQKEPHQSTNVSFGTLIDHLLCTWDGGSLRATWPMPADLSWVQQETALSKWMGDQLKRLHCPLGWGVIQILLHPSRTCGDSDPASAAHYPSQFEPGFPHP